MQEQIAFVRTEFARSEPPPASQRGIGGWLKDNLFATPADIAMTIVGIALVALALPPIVDWAFLDAQWTGTDRSFCATTTQQGGIQPEGWSGACWAFVKAKMSLILYGRYPLAERWRVVLVAALFVALLVPLLIPRVPRKGLNALGMFVIFPVVAFFLLSGGWFGLPHVETSIWGGLMVTLIISFVGIVVSLPLGIVLALGRRSEMPVVKLLSIVFIETVRGVPLITVLFMASVMFPLFLPPGVNFDVFLRALIGVCLFAAAYMAEVVRGGLQAIPKGQFEGADSLGLGYWQKMILIILPQALRLVIPGIVNTFIGMFKDTSLVSIIGMFDLLGIIRQSFSDANWASPQTPISGLVFIGFVYWLFCFGMSRYSSFMERRLATGYSR